MIAAPQGPIRLARGRHGLFAVNGNDAYVGRSLLLYGEFSEPEVELLATLPHRGVLVEVGANIGALTVPLARHFGAVLAIEPQRLVYQLLVANLALNDVRNVRTVLAACGADEGTVAVPCLGWDGPNNFGGLALDVPHDGAPSEPAPLLRLEDVAVSCDVLKLDCEGMEEAVLVGANRLTSWARLGPGQRRPILYVENDRAEKRASLIHWIRDCCGYRLWWHRPLLYSPANAAGLSENVFGRIASQNMLCVPVESGWMPDVERFALEAIR